MQTSDIEFNRLQIVSRDLSDVPAFTLLAVIRNEMYFLPEFLTHYRRLGVGRFIFLDDKSDDGTRAFLARQSDVMAVESSFRFGDRVAKEVATSYGLPHQRMDLFWRTLLLRQFCPDQWCLQLDADEFIDLPGQMTLSDLVAHVEASDMNARAVWSVMLDVYPSVLGDLSAPTARETFTPDADWYFDARPHLRLRGASPPKQIYPGSRARLLCRHGLNPKVGRGLQKLSHFLGLVPPRYNCIYKPVLLKPRADSVYETSHRVNLPAHHEALLPMRHYKFSGATFARMHEAIADGQHPGGASEYAVLVRLLQNMQDTNPSFLGKHSERVSGFAGFRASGNAKGLG